MNCQHISGASRRRRFRPGICAGLLGVGLAVAGCGGGASHPNLRSAQYTFTDLGANLRATGVSPAGQIVGVHSVGGQPQGFFYSNGTLTTLPEIGGQPVAPAAVSASGVVVGSYFSTSDGRTHAFQSSGGAASDIFLDRDSLNSCKAAAINGAGQVAVDVDGGHVLNSVYSYSGGAFTGVSHADSSGTRAVGIDAAGAVVVNGSLHAYFCEGGSSLDLGGQPGLAQTQAMGVNDAGQVVGNCDSGVVIDPPGQDHNPPPKAFLWDRSSGMRVLNGLRQADAINNRGQVAGLGVGTGGTYTIMVWQNGTATNLSAQVSGLPTLTDVQIVGITDSGQIVGTYDGSGGGYHTFLLTPR